MALTNDPPKEVTELLTVVDKAHYSVVHHTEEPDKYAWRRQEVANRLGVKESELADEPDNDPGSPEQAWA